MSLNASAGSVFATALVFGSAGLAVILTRGQANWVPQNHWLAPALFSIGGVLVLWSIWINRMSPTKIPRALDQIGQTMICPETHGGDGPALAAGRDIHVNYGLPASAPPVLSGVLKDSKPVTAAPSPNFEYVGSKEKRVFVSPLARDGICDPRNEEEHEMSLQALVLKFENRVLADRKIARAMNLIAKVRFKSKDGVTERLIDYGVWLNSPCNSTDMGIGDTRELVLMYVLDSKLMTLEDRREANHRFYDPFSYIDSGCVDGLEMVDITVIDKNTQASFHREFRVWHEGANFFCRVAGSAPH